jgi:octaprenyl-diphosphate synthase
LRSHFAGRSSLRTARTNLMLRQRVVLTTCEGPFYSAFVELSMHSAAAPAVPDSPLGRVASVVRVQLAEVEARIAEQTSAFDPAIEGYLAYAVGSRGKRLRPLMALLSGGATGPIKSEHIDLAIVVELIHLATLVHDDIVDEAERRRSQPTVNARWGNSLSVLLGDCLFAHALHLSANFENSEVSRAIARAAREVCTGEIIQTQRRFDLHLGIDDYLRIIQMKTGSLFAVAAELGAVLSGANAATAQSLKEFGERVGTAYQIYDDCLDIAGDEEASGKTLGTDLRKGKLTLPVLMLLQSAPAFEKERCAELILEGNLTEITRLVKEAAANGALSASIEAGQDLLREAEAGLAGLPASVYGDALVGLSEAVRELFEQVRE